MFDPNVGDDLFEVSHWSQSPLQPALSSLYPWIKRTHNAIKKTAVTSCPNVRDRRTAIALGSICFLIGLHALVATDSGSLDVNDRALHQLLVSELPNVEPGEAQVTTSNSVVDIESLLQNEYGQPITLYRLLIDGCVSGLFNRSQQHPETP